MGMFIGLVFMVHIIVMMIIYSLIKKRFSHKPKIVKFTYWFLILLPVADIIIVYVLTGFHCVTTKSTYINKQIQYPNSIYWEDNIYEGFSKEDRELMIINYLDGKHLKTMALNGTDGKIYVYSADENDYKNIVNKSKYKKVFQKYKEYASFIMKSKKIYSKQTMPKMNYTVKSDEVNLNFLYKIFFYSDETKIINNKTNKIIAYNQRLIHFKYNLYYWYDTPNEYYMKGGEMCGDKYVRNFDEKIFPKLKFLYGGNITNKISLNTKLYNKYKKEEK